MSNLVVLGFDGLHTADDVLNKLRSLQKEYLIDLEDACVVERVRHCASDRVGWRIGLRLRSNRAAVRFRVDVVRNLGGDVVSAAPTSRCSTGRPWLGTADRAGGSGGDIGAGDHRGYVAGDFHLFFGPNVAEPRRHAAAPAAVAGRHSADWQKTD